MKIEIEMRSTSAAERLESTERAVRIKSPGFDTVQFRWYYGPCHTDCMCWLRLMNEGELRKQGLISSIGRRGV